MGMGIVGFGSFELVGLAFFFCGDARGWEWHVGSILLCAVQLGVVQSWNSCSWFPLCGIVLHRQYRRDCLATYWAGKGIIRRSGLVKMLQK